MTAAKVVLEPILEADFLPSSFGFRPKRSAHHALDAVRQAANRGMVWVLDADIAACFGAPSHCPFGCWRGIEETGIGSIHLDSQPFLRPERTWTASSSPCLTR